MTTCAHCNGPVGDNYAPPPWGGITLLWESSLGPSVVVSDAKRFARRPVCNACYRFDQALGEILDSCVILYREYNERM